ncbi:MAG: GDP-mannose 4,6-dehydratase [Chloroflexi bacterium]|nr:GDP-mannose 4,6-dehydratase [Chloroflexota bacterium]
MSGLLDPGSGRAVEYVRGGLRVVGVPGDHSAWSVCLKVVATWEHRRVLITGGAGFIGSHLAEAALAEGAQVTVVDEVATGRCEHQDGLSNLEVIEARVGTDAFASLLRSGRFDTIFHLAGSGYVPPSVEDPYFDFERNLHPTIRLLECLRLHRLATPLVFASSATVYGAPRELPIAESAPLDPVSPYGVSKLASERYVAVYARLYGLRAASMRLFSVYGPRQRKQVVYDLIDRLHRNPEVLTILGDGTQERDFTYVTDVAQAALLIAARGALAGETYNVATGETCSTLELAREVAAALGLDPQLRFTGAVRPGDADRWAADISRVRALGYAPRVDLRQGIRETVAWYLSAAAEDRSPRRHGDTESS